MVMNYDDWRRFYQNCNPSKKLENQDDRRLYTDFTPVRGASIIETLITHIQASLPEPKPKLFTGLTGCGKSTELLQLKYQLEQKKFYVIYFDLTDVHIDLNNVVVTDIFLAVAAKVDKALEEENIQLQKQNLQTKFLQPLKKKFDISEVDISFSLFIFKLNTKAKVNKDTKNELTDFLEPQIDSFVTTINQDLLESGVRALKGQKDKEGLVVLIDGLDRCTNSTAIENLFAKRGGQLQELNCQIIYTVPIAMNRSPERTNIDGLFGSLLILPMIQLEEKNGDKCERGFILLQEMILKRAFLDIPYRSERAKKILELFDKEETLNSLCISSGGHIRTLISILHDCIRDVLQRKSNPLLISRDIVERQIQKRSQEMIDSVKDEQWKLLSKVKATKEIDGREGYHDLISASLIYRYETRTDGRWYDINPLLRNAKQLDDTIPEKS